MFEIHFFFYKGKKKNIFFFFSFFFFFFCIFLSHVAVCSKSMFAANGDKKLFFPTAVQSYGILYWLRGNFFLETLFCKFSSLTLAITLGPCNEGLDFANFVSNI